MSLAATRSSVPAPGLSGASSTAGKVLCLESVLVHVPLPASFGQPAVQDLTELHVAAAHCQCRSVVELHGAFALENRGGAFGREHTARAGYALVCASGVGVVAVEAGHAAWARGAAGRLGARAALHLSPVGQRHADVVEGLYLAHLQRLSRGRRKDEDVPPEGAAGALSLEHTVACLADLALMLLRGQDATTGGVGVHVAVQVEAVACVCRRHHHNEVGSLTAAPEPHCPKHAKPVCSVKRILEINADPLRVVVVDGVGSAEASDRVAVRGQGACRGIEALESGLPRRASPAVRPAPLHQVARRRHGGNLHCQTSGGALQWIKSLVSQLIAQVVTTCTPGPERLSSSVTSKLTVPPDTSETVWAALDLAFCVTPVSALCVCVVAPFAQASLADAIAAELKLASRIASVVGIGVAIITLLQRMWNPIATNTGKHTSRARRVGHEPDVAGAHCVSASSASFRLSNLAVRAGVVAGVTRHALCTIH
eukprot:1994935-Rhodomonas_salina.3